MKPSIPRGTRDFGPDEMRKRNYILQIIRRNFELFGYQPIETPAMENLSTLMGKYGEEGDKLIFKIVDSGVFSEDSDSFLFHNPEPLLSGMEEAKTIKNFKSDISSLKERLREITEVSSRSTDQGEDLAQREILEAELAAKEHELSKKTDHLRAKIAKLLTEKALRYDLTVPFARYVVMNHHQISFPFKRYQIQPVWRADRPQKGRYREFYQCDADVIGSDSMTNELDLVSMIDRSFASLNIPVILKFNNRKILTAIAELMGAPDMIVPITVAIDKLDKIGKEGVNKELKEKGISEEAVAMLQPLLEFKGGNESKVSVLHDLVGKTPTGQKGMEEIRFILDHVKTKHAVLELDITLARGLSYYTGTIFEVKASAVNFTPSILGGGRYDDLTGIFGLPKMSGVGISFGIDRIYDVMEELNSFPDTIGNHSFTQIMFAHFDEESRMHCMKLSSELRDHDISCEVYPDLTKKLGKQFDYANKAHIPFVCAVGSNEMQSGIYSLKNMANGEQVQLKLQEIIQRLKSTV